ncbi:MAG: O-antigen ligase family protein [Clostridia bacterium]|nr:O-antigen ligase family protein [Clostridia bacterium]
MILKLNKNIFYDISLFRIFYVISLLFEIIAISPIEIFAGYLNGIIFIWGIFICLHIMFKESYKFNIKNKNIAFLFIILGVFTSCFNFSSNILMNLIINFNNLMCIFLFLGMSKNTSQEKADAEVNFLFKFIIYFSFFVSIFSIYILFAHKHINFMGHDLGISQNRFFGITTNPNQLAFLSVISIFSCDFLQDKYFKNKFKINKFFLRICMALNIITLFLTDSNAAFIFITIYLSIKLFYENFSSYDKFKNIKFLREIIFVSMLIIFLVSGSFLLRMGCQKLVTQIINSQKINENLPEEQKTLKLDDFKEPLKIGRGNHELSSGRILLFKQGIKLSKIHPIVGIGRENLYYYSRIYLDGGLAFPYNHADLHNIYLTIIVSYGWLGFALFMILILSYIYKIAHVIFIKMHSMNSKLISKLFAIIIAYFVYASFEVGILSGIAFADILIWLYLGYAVMLINSDKKNNF